MLKKNVFLSKESKKEHIANLLESFKDSGGKFEIYDACYPSPSDPGAYICYSAYDVKKGSFSMTLGNHGWSGGIYQIKEKVVLEQLYHLAVTQEKFKLNIENAAFFSHYSKESLKTIGR